MTAKFIPENSALLAKEIAGAGLTAATISCASGAEFEKIRIRPIALKSGEAWQAEQFRGPKVFHRNIDADSLAAELERVFEAGVTSADFTLARGATRTIKILTNRRGEASVLRISAPKGLPATQTTDECAVPAPAPHNRAKRYILEEGIAVPFLVDLGVMTNDGAVIKAKYDKFRQVNRFLEFIQDVVPELERELRDNAVLTADGTDEARATGAPTRELTIVDFGCGKSYLTFAVYHYLSNIKKLPVRIIGLDLKEDVIDDCSHLAERYGYDRLHFAVGDIASFTGCERADMVITLHACDTATDYALAQAIKWNASVILSVPCCQHELNAQLGAGKRNADGGQLGAGREILESAFKYGIIRERMAALFTDAMRAELLEHSGYHAQILEFIDMSHTPKNLLIRAVRDRSIKDSATKDHLDGASRANATTGEAHVPTGDSYEKLRDFLGVNQMLESLLKNGNGD